MQHLLLPLKRGSGLPVICPAQKQFHSVPRACLSPSPEHHWAALSPSSSQPQSKTIACKSRGVPELQNSYQDALYQSSPGGKGVGTGFSNTAWLCWAWHPPWLLLLLFTSSFHLRLKLADIPWASRTQTTKFHRKLTHKPSGLMHLFQRVRVFINTSCLMFLLPVWVPLLKNKP